MHFSLTVLILNSTVGGLCRIGRAEGETWTAPIRRTFYFLSFSCTCIWEFRRSESTIPFHSTLFAVDRSFVSKTPDYHCASQRKVRCCSWGSSVARTKRAERGNHATSVGPTNKGPMRPIYFSSFTRLKSRLSFLPSPSPQAIQVLKAAIMKYVLVSGGVISGVGKVSCRLPRL